MVTVVITAEQAAQNRVDLHEFVGQQILISRRGTGFLTDYEFTNLDTGGFRLTGNTGDITEGETFFIWPASKIIFTTVQPASGGVQQYPHLVKIFVNNWSSGEDGISTYRGRAETGANAKKGYNQDDTSVMSIVYLPLPVETVELGTPVEVYWNEKIVITGPVKQFSRGQLNARIWL